MEVKIKTKGVSFNLNDPDQLELFEHACKRKNFSSYIKRLIQKDITGNWGNGLPVTQNEEPELEFDPSLASGLV